MEYISDLANNKVKAIYNVCYKRAIILLKMFPNKSLPLAEYHDFNGNVFDTDFNSRLIDFSEIYLEKDKDGEYCIKLKDKFDGTEYTYGCGFDNGYMLEDSIILDILDIIESEIKGIIELGAKFVGEGLN